MKLCNLQIINICEIMDSCDTMDVLWEITGLKSTIGLRFRKAPTGLLAALGELASLEKQDKVTGSCMKPCNLASGHHTKSEHDAIVQLRNCSRQRTLRETCVWLRFRNRTSPLEPPSKAESRPSALVEAPSSQAQLSALLEVSKLPRSLNSYWL